MAKKATFFFSAFLLFFCFGLVGAQEIKDEIATTTDRQSTLTAGVVATPTDALITPAPQSATTTKEAEMGLIKDQEFSKECSLWKCRVPIPTLRKPDRNKVNSSERIYVTGLTWNNTNIDVYVDGKYVGQAIVKNDDKSNTANFYYQLSVNNLSNGDHKWSVIAWSPNNRDRSYVSRENVFSVNSATILESKKSEVMENKDNGSTSSISEQRENVDIVTSEQQEKISVSEDVSDAGVSVTSSEENNMLVVDKDKKSDENVNREDEKLQSATPSEEVKQEVKNDLDVNKNKDANRKIGIILLAVLVFFVGLSAIVFRKKE